MNSLLTKVFEGQVQQCPKQVAVEQSGRTLSYESLNAYANQIGDLLQQLCLPAEGVVVSLLPSSIEMVAGLLGIFKAGGVYLPIDLDFPSARIARILEETEASVMVVRADQWDRVQTLGTTLGLPPVRFIVLHPDASIRVSQAWGGCPQPASSLSERNLKVALDEEGANYIFYTSGTTGPGKAVLGCHKSLSHFIHWEVGEFELDATCRVSQLSQVTFDASLRDVFVPLTVGGRLCVADRDIKENLPQLIDWIEAHRISLIHCVPSVLRLLNSELGSGERRVERRFPSLRYLLMAGEALYGRDIAVFRQQVGDHVELVNLYGTSETTLAKTFHRIGSLSGDSAQLIPAGKPISNTAVAIINADHICKVGELGEIYIKTPFATKGYFRNEALTRQVFVQNPLVSDRDDRVHKTGDLGRYLPDRSIEVVGRRDDQVKVNGVRVRLSEIEQAVLKCSGVEQCVLQVHVTRSYHSELLCYYVGGGVSAESLKAFLQTQLSRPLIPTYCMALDRFPLTLNGKVDKKALPKPEDLLIGQHEYQAVQTETEAGLEAIWQEVLGLRRIGRNLSFFQIGGSSLKAIQVISRVYREFGVSLKVVDLFAHQDIASLARLVEGSQVAEYAAIPPVSLAEHYPLSHAQRRLWIMDQLQEEQIAYNMANAFELEGALDRGVLASVFRILIERHESLRTVIITVDGEPRQQVHTVEESKFRLQYEAVEEGGDQAERVRQRAEAEVRLPFRLYRLPLLRCRLLGLGGDRHVLVLTMHHIISDGWSLQVMFEEILVLYGALVRGRAPILPPLRVQYKDYAVWQQNQFSGDSLAAHRDYWVNQFSDYIPPLEPSATHSLQLKSYKGRKIQVQIESNVADEIRVFCKKQGVTLFMFLISCTNIILYRLSGLRDRVLGIPVNGRNHVDLENQIGLFVNMLAVRFDLETYHTFSECLGYTKSRLLEAHKHDTYPLDLLMSDLNMSELNGTALFNVVVQMQEVHGAGGSMNQLVPGSDSGIDTKSFEIESGTSKFDLTFDFFDSSTSIDITIEYDSDLFEVERVRNMGREFQVITSVVTDQPDISFVAIKKHLREASTFNESDIAFKEQLSEDF